MTPATKSFFKSRWVTPPKGVEELDPAQLAPGFRAAGVACGIKGGGETDVGLLVCDVESVRSAIALTANAAAAAPVRVCRDELEAGAIRAVAVNSGNANAATGEQGYRDAVAMRDAAAGALGLEPATVAIAETGTIGVPLEVGAVTSGIGQAARDLRADGGEEFAVAIMTTDRDPKRCTLRAGGVTLSAQAKGAGMIQPGFATMLCFVQTDGELENADSALRTALAGSMERITVDGQLSTNDTVILQASGESGREVPEGLLESALRQLALEIVADGEGATRVCRVTVRRARDAEEADRVARAIGNSPLVKTALYGRDSNWGRIAQAAGMALAGEELEELGPDRVEAADLASESAEAEIAVTLGRGDGVAVVYFSDLTPEYIRINSEYTT